MKYLYTLFAFCFCVLHLSTAYADNSSEISHTYAYEWSDGSYAAYNDLVIESVTTVDIPCFGGTRGTVTIEVSGATPPITYDVGVAGTATVVDESFTFFQSLDADTYNLTVTDADGCEAFETFVINETTPLQITSTPIGESLPGANDGSVSICVQGGVPGYIVTAMPSATVTQVSGACDGNFEVNNLPEGVYTFTIEDQNGCVATDVVTIESGICDNVVSSVSTASPLTVCKDGMADEVLLENNIGGMVGADYAYVVTDINDIIVLWNQSANSYNIDLLPPGVYRIYGFDFQGILTVPVGSPVNDISSSADCISLSQDFVEAEVVAQPSTAVAGTDITLCGPSVVTLSADSVAIGTGMWTQVSGAVATIADSLAATTDVSDLVSGLYEFEWSVSNGICPPSRDTVEVLIADTAIEIDSITIIDETCNVDNNGSATVSVTGAFPPITYDIGISGLTVNISDTSHTYMSSLPAGNYAVTVTDAAGCFAVDSFIVNQPDSLYILPTVTAVTEIGLDDGIIVLCVDGGVQPFTLTSVSSINIDTIEGDCDGNYIIDSLAAGEYIFNLLDGIGCEVSETVVVAPGDCAIRIDSVVVNSNVSCFGDNDGQLTVHAAGSSSGNYQFSIDNGTTFTPAPASLSFTNLTAGTYDIIVVDELGCQDTFMNNSVTVSTPIDFSITQINTVDVSAPGANDGEIEFCANGAIPPYTVTYSGTDTGVSGIFSLVIGSCAGNFRAINLPGDNYVVEVTDANGCTEKFEVFVDDVDCAPFSLINTIPVPVACNGDSTGTIEMITSGGFAPYTYVIDNGASSDTISGISDASFIFNDLPEGSYTLTAIHSGDCAVQSTAIITEPSPLSASISTIDGTVVGGTDGEICITPMGGAMSYTVTSDCGLPVQMPGNCGGTYHISGLSEGECTITIVDDNGCIFSTSAELISPSCAGFSLVSVTPTDVACGGQNDGLISIEVAGGNPNYRYSIDGGNTFIENANNEFTFENLSAGNYQIVVEDDLGCEVSFNSATINEPLPIAIEVETTASCSDADNGGIDVTPSGGTGTYIYWWNTSDTSQDLDQLAAGTYDLSITDTNACMFSTTITVDEHPIIDVNLGTNQIIDATDSIQLMANVSAMQDYTFSWSPIAGLNDPNSLSPWASPTTTTTYTLTVTSEEGCISSDDIIISVNPVRQVVAVPSAFTPNDDGENDELDIIIQGNFELVSFHVFNRWGEEIFFTENANTRWDGTYKGERQPIGTYVYVLKYEDASGATLEEGGDVTLLR